MAVSFWFCLFLVFLNSVIGHKINLSAFHQGGVSKGYKNYIEEKGLPDDTYTEEGLALFRVQGSGPDNMQAIQVEPVSLVFISFFFVFLV